LCPRLWKAAVFGGRSRPRSWLYWNFKQIKAAKKEPQMEPRTPTFGEWLQIYSDLDAYIAAGGQLMDLYLVGLEQIEEQIGRPLGLFLSLETCDRVNRFFDSVAKATGRATVAEIFSESELRALWHQTATMTDRDRLNGNA
jgi:hypothetical protein